MRATVASTEKERARQVCVNEAFSSLRRVLPSHPPNKKMSKHEILRGAIRYIALLEQIMQKQRAAAAAAADDDDDA